MTKKENKIGNIYRNPGHNNRLLIVLSETKGKSFNRLICSDDDYFCLYCDEDFMFLDQTIYHTDDELDNFDYQCKNKKMAEKIMSLINEYKSFLGSIVDVVTF